MPGGHPGVLIPVLHLMYNISRSQPLVSLSSPLSSSHISSHCILDISHYRQTLHYYHTDAHHLAYPPAFISLCRVSNGPWVSLLSSPTPCVTIHASLMFPADQVLPYMVR